MARGARGVGPMTIELLPNGDGAANVGLDSRHSARGRGMEAENALHDPHAANHWRCCRAVRRHLKNAGLSHQAAPHRLLRELHFAHGCTRYFRNAVMPGEALIEES